SIGVAKAAPYEIQVRQLNPNGWIYNKICEDTEACHVFMGIVPQSNIFETDDLELDVGAFLREENIYFQFKSGWDYFFVSQDKNYFSIKWEDQKKTTEIVKL